MEDGSRVERALSWDEHKEKLSQIRKPPGIDPNRGYAGFQFNEREGVVAVESVIAGTPAHRAGLRKGDAILSVDGEWVGSAVRGEVGSFISKTTGWQEGDQVEIEFQRAGEKYLLSLELASGLEVQEAVESEQEAEP